MSQTRKMKPTRQNVTSSENEDNFMYLGVQLTKSGNEVDEIKH